MNKAYKFRIYPNSEQRILFAKTFGCVRFIYNKMLGDKIECYEQTKENFSCYPSQYKAEYEWLKEVDSLALVGAYNNLQTAYNNFFRSPKVGFPKFKSKKHNHNSYTTNCVNNNIKLENGYLILPKVKSVKIKQHR
ncbi:MAG: helix-turn-helix domain-containing protein, partial [Clostridia bacterium]